MQCYKSVEDPRFPRGGGGNIHSLCTSCLRSIQTVNTNGAVLQVSGRSRMTGRGAIYDFAKKFPPKLHEKNLARGGGGSCVQNASTVRVHVPEADPGFPKGGGGEAVTFCLV